LVEKLLTPDIVSRLGRTNKDFEDFANLIKSSRNEKILDKDRLHQDRERGGQIALEKGIHPIRFEFFDAGGGYRLQLRYSVEKEVCSLFQHPGFCKANKLWRTKLQKELIITGRPHYL
jgi:hypothetical protein